MSLRRTHKDRVSFCWPRVFEATTLGQREVG